MSKNITPVTIKPVIRPLIIISPKKIKDSHKAAENVIQPIQKTTIQPIQKTTIQPIQKMIIQPEDENKPLSEDENKPLSEDEIIKLIDFFNLILILGIRDFKRFSDLDNINDEFEANPSSHTSHHYQTLLTLYHVDKETLQDKNPKHNLAAKLADFIISKLTHELCDKVTLYDTDNNIVINKKGITCFNIMQASLGFLDDFWTYPSQHLESVDFSSYDSKTGHLSLVCYMNEDT